MEDQLSQQFFVPANLFEDVSALTPSEEIDYILADDTTLPQMSRAKHWCFTLNNFTAQDIDRIAAIEDEVEYLIYGKEVGASGTPHLQGFVSFKERLRRNQVVAKVGQAHFTVARNIHHSIEYCKKEGDYVEIGVAPKGPGRRNDLEAFKQAVKEGQFCHRILREEHSEIYKKYHRFCIDYVNDNIPSRVVPTHPLYDWQATLWHDLSLTADDRKIVFCVDLDGNTGKSWFCQHYCAFHDNAQIVLPGKVADMSYMLDPTARVVFLDCPRSKQGEFIQYDFLEHIKNGLVFSGKYESRMKTLGSVHVVVMTNERPDMSKLSADRYDVRIVRGP